jgi:hypothetical protein
MMGRDRLIANSLHSRVWPTHSRLGEKFTRETKHREKWEIDIANHGSMFIQRLIDGTDIKSTAYRVKTEQTEFS